MAQKRKLVITIEAEDMEARGVSKSCVETFRELAGGDTWTGKWTIDVALRWAKMDFEWKKCGIVGLLERGYVPHVFVSANLRRNDLSRATLDGVDFVRADLYRANLSYSSFRFADLRGTNLRKSNIVSADLRSAKLVFSDLRDADLREADIREACLNGCDLRGAKLNGVNMRGACLDETDLRGSGIDLDMLEGVSWRLALYDEELLFQ